MHKWTTCPGCGLELPSNRWSVPPRSYASSECVELSGEVVGFEAQHLELVRDCHQMTVDAYLAQHAPPPASSQPIGVPFSLVGLHLALDHGVAGTVVRDIHQRMGRMARRWPVFEPPQTRGDLTVYDVAEAGLMIGSVAGHGAAVRRWATAIWQAWACHHAAVSALTDEITGAG